MKLARIALIVALVAGGAALTSAPAVAAPGCSIAYQAQPWTEAPGQGRVHGLGHHHQHRRRRGRVDAAVRPARRAEPHPGLVGHLEPRTPGDRHQRPLERQPRHRRLHRHRLQRALERDVHRPGRLHAQRHHLQRRGGGPANQPPTVSLTSPAAGQSFAAGAIVPLAATAADPDGRVARVEFLVDGALVATDTTAPYTAARPGSAPAATLATARAVDDASRGVHDLGRRRLTVAGTDPGPGPGGKVDNPLRRGYRLRQPGLAGPGRAGRRRHGVGRWAPACGWSGSSPPPCGWTGSGPSTRPGRPSACATTSTPPPSRTAPPARAAHHPDRDLRPAEPRLRGPGLQRRAADRRGAGWTATGPSTSTPSGRCSPIRPTPTCGSCSSSSPTRSQPRDQRERHAGVAPLRRGPADRRLPRRHPLAVSRLSPAAQHLPVPRHRPLGLVGLAHQLRGGARGVDRTLAAGQGGPGYDKIHGFVTNTANYTPLDEGPARPEPPGRRRPGDVVHVLRVQPRLDEQDFATDRRPRSPPGAAPAAGCSSTRPATAGAVRRAPAR